MSLGKQSIIGVFWNSFANFIGFLVSFAGQLFLVRLLLPEDFGNYALASSIFEVLSIFTTWSLSLVLIQQPDSDNLTDTAIWLSIFQGILLILISFIVSLFLKLYYPTLKALPVIFVIMGISRAVSYLSSIYSAELEKNLSYKRLAISKSIATIISTIAGILIALKNYGVWSLVWKEFILIILSLIFYKYLSGSRFKWNFSTIVAKKLLNVGAKMSLSKGLESAFYRMDNLIIGFWGGMNTLGYYSQAKYLVELSNTAIAPVSQTVAYPLYSKVQNDDVKLKESLKIQNYFLARTTFLLSLIFFLFPSELIRFLFDEKWQPSSVALKWLCFYPVLVPLFINLKMFLFSIGKVSITIWIYLFQTLIVIPLVAYGMQYLGLKGSAIGFSIALLLGYITICIFTHSYIFENLRDTVLVPIVSWIVIVICVSPIKGYLISNSDLFSIVKALSVVAILYFIILVLFEKTTLIKNLNLISNKLK